MRQRKVEFYQPFERELEAVGVEYRPVTFSCFGRPHEDSRLLVQSLARRFASIRHLPGRCLRPRPRASR
eukprot:9660572-Lingulodinium_polyedra.AAC.1